MDSVSSLYLHVPFCRHRCGYCNFALVAKRDHLIDAYLQAIEIEIARSIPRGKIKTVFVGGGTPTHLSILQLEKLFSIVESRFEIDEECEFSMEGNPADIDTELVDFLFNKGVNRISLGAQSLNPGKLRFLERDHEREAVFAASEIIRRKFGNFSLDLMFGTAGESLDSWAADIRDAVSCNPTHISTYSLTVEKGTQFWNRQNQRQEIQVEQEQAAELYELGLDALQAYGFRHYEISNFSQPGFECVHNINYWQGGEYFGFGPGAARYLAGVRASNHPSTVRYIKLLLAGEDPTSEVEKLDAEQIAREKIIFGLRQVAGIDLEAFRQHTGFGVAALLGECLDRLIDQRLMQVQGTRLKLTRQGLMVSDSIWPDFL